jgi:hypothetical protein
MKRNSFRKKINIIVGIALLSQVFCVGCEYEDPKSYKIKYRITCDNSTDLIININKCVNEQILFHGENWETEFRLYLNFGDDIRPKINVINNTNNDVSIAAEIFVDGVLQNSEAAAGSFAEISIESKKLHGY